nr:MAG TPA: hypothetical protein [Caudoviricetes sp.]
MLIQINTQMGQSIKHPLLLVPWAISILYQSIKMNCSNLGSQGIYIKCRCALELILCIPR